MACEGDCDASGKLDRDCGFGFGGVACRLFTERAEI
jgi:hypothetical protein